MAVQLTVCLLKGNGVRVAMESLAVLCVEINNSTPNTFTYKHLKGVYKTDFKSLS